MGVKGLWRLLLPIGRRISLESLEGKVLAIDASIWLIQFIKAMRDKDTGKALPHAHLTGFFKRICRLKYHGIRPIFVFDGVTPEIKKRETTMRRKRRETFASALHNDASVQRLAKRILAQNLKTKKKPPAPLALAQAPGTAAAAAASSSGDTVETNHASSSFADCFNPGEQEPVAVAASTAAATDRAAGSSGSNAVSREDEAAIMAAIQDMVEEEEEEVKKTKAALEQRTNDWDCPIEEEEEEAGGECMEEDNDNDDDNDEHVTLYDDCNGSDHDNNNDNDSLNVSYIASLPPDKRKDAIEKAKRRQRMKSRQEFMPAAGNMDQFSSVQLTNFLKSSRLNQDIVRMAQQAAQNDQQQQNQNHQQGFFMASDHTMRISLIREGKNNQQDQEEEDRKMPARAGGGRLRHVGQQLQAKSRRQQSSSTTSLLSASNKRCYHHNNNNNDSSPSSDNDDEWQGRVDQNRKRAAASMVDPFRSSPPSNKRSRRRIRIDEQEEEEEEGDDNDGLPTEEELAGGFLVSGRTADIESTANVATTSCNVGGHVFQLGNQENVKHNSQDTGGGFLSSEKSIDVIRLDEDDDSDSEEEGGFLKVPSAAAAVATTTSCVAKDVILLNDDDDEEDSEEGGFLKGPAASGNDDVKSTPVCTDEPCVLATSASKAFDPNKSSGATQRDEAEDDDTKASQDEACGISGGGFIVSTTQLEPAMKRHLQLAIEEDDSDSNDEQEGGKCAGIFGVKTGPSDVINLADDASTDNDSADESSSNPRHSKKRNKNNSTTSCSSNVSRKDAALAQEMEDRLLAQAIQDSEEGGVAVAADPMEVWEESTVATGNLTRVAAAAINAAAASACAHASVPRSLKQSTTANGNEGSDDDGGCDDDDDNIDWEDGDGENEEDIDFEEKPVEYGNGNNTSVEGEQKRCDTYDSKIPSVDYGDKRDSDNDIVDGEEAESRLLADLDTGEQMRAVAMADSDGVGIFTTSDDRGGPITLPMIETGAYSAEAAAALERAQATASNLANWAGRVFRQVVKEVGEQDRVSPAKLPPATAPSAEKASDDTNVAPVDGSGDANVLAKRNLDAAQSSSPRTHANEQQQSNRNPISLESQSVLESKHRSEEDADLEMVDRPTRNGSTRIISDEVREATAAMLNEYDEQWTAERNQRERDSDTVTDEMKEDAIQLLRLFGVPYVEAPTEAEAQCAALEDLGLVDGIVTEDSDVFVFGGKRVYKHIFEERLYAEAYMADDAEREMSLGRNSMVALAMLLGSDYTEGVKGVGIVNSMEVLQAFDVSQDLSVGLSQFRKWLDGFDPSDSTESGKPIDKAGLTKEQIFHANHKTARNRWEAPSNFPSKEVMQAYLNPVVDKSTERFSWGVPDVENLVVFCSRHMGWPAEDTRRLLEPIVARNTSGLRQTRIDSFMKYEDGIKFGDVKSQRLREVLGLKAPETESHEDKHH